MNIYAFIPLVAILAYIPLLIATIRTRLWTRQNKLFLVFLIAATLWSLVDYICRSQFFLAYSYLLLQIVIVMFVWMAIQFHSFTSSFFPSGKGRWLPFAYGSLGVIVILAAAGYLPQSVTIDGDKLNPDYGWALYVVMVPLVVLLARNFYILFPLLKKQENPVLFNQVSSLLLCLALLTIFMSMSVFSFGKEFPVSHLGNIFNAVVLSYAVVGHQLVDIRFVLRRGFIWFSIAIVGLSSFWLILLGLHQLLKIPFTFALIFIDSVSALLALIIFYQTRGIISKFMGKALQGEKFYYRERLTEFFNKIHNVFSLKEQGGELLTLVTHAMGCRKAGLMFPNAIGEFEIQLIDPVQKDKSFTRINFRANNPIVEYLKTQRKILARENLEIQPQFKGLWQWEKESLDDNNIELFVPLISRDRLIGVLVLDKKISGRYTLEDYDLLEKVTNRVSVSMEKEFLREQLKEREEELSVINRSNAIIASSLDIQRIYDNFIKELKQIVDVDWAAIDVVEDTEIYFMAISTEIGSPWKAGERIPLKGTANEWLINHHSQFIIEPDLRVENRFVTGKYHLQHGICSIVYFPLIISNQVIGTLTVASRKPDAYNSRQLKLLEQLASQIAMPIENARLYARTERMARVDSLTGLLNRRSLDEILPSEIGRHSRYGGVFSLIILDLDSFKLLNDTYGHLAGDDLLRQIGHIMRTAIREADQAFRYGGDEFAILLPQTSVEAAFKVSERIRQQTYAQVEIRHKPITLSLGLASWPADGVGANDIIAAADAALYQAKRSGGNRSQCSFISLSPDQVKRNVVGSTDNQDSSALSAIFALAATVDARDRLTRNHSKQVHEYSLAIGTSLGLDPLEINRLGTCALLHDIGKIGISDEILNKKEPLTEKEWEIIKTHPQLGAAIASHSIQLSPCVQGILHHHEKYNGEGYPDGLKGESIPLESRILAIADAFATMTSRHVYAQSKDCERAIVEIKNGAGTQFDPKLVEVFLSVIPKLISFLEQIKTGSDI